MFLFEQVRRRNSTFSAVFIILETSYSKYFHHFAEVANERHLGVHMTLAVEQEGSLRKGVYGATMPCLNSGFGVVQPVSNPHVIRQIRSFPAAFSTLCPPTKEVIDWIAHKSHPIQIRNFWIDYFSLMVTCLLDDCCSSIFVDVNICKFVIEWSCGPLIRIRSISFLYGKMVFKFILLLVKSLLLLERETQIGIFQFAFVSGCSTGSFFIVLLGLASQMTRLGRVLFFVSLSLFCELEHRFLRPLTIDRGGQHQYTEKHGIEPEKGITPTRMLHLIGSV
mmetsp:Transcript_114528/g.171277  ORF Transcript_114528/g.171277 Transcript_114528/m.171277 type:complete len:279 (+) Transcript_114528:2238-3074(+)